MFGGNRILRNRLHLYRMHLHSGKAIYQNLNIDVKGRSYINGELKGYVQQCIMWKKNEKSVDG